MSSKNVLAHVETIHGLNYLTFRKWLYSESFWEEILPCASQFTFLHPNRFDLVFREEEFPLEGQITLIEEGEYEPGAFCILLYMKPNFLISAFDSRIRCRVLPGNCLKIGFFVQELEFAPDALRYGSLFGFGLRLRKLVRQAMIRLQKRTELTLIE